MPHVYDIPVASYVVRFFGDREAWESIGDFGALAREYPDRESNRAAWWKLINALPTGEKGTSGTRSAH